MADNSDALPSATSRTPVVGIGASAGGITALQKFFDVLDDNLGAAFVVVVHLDPRHSSELPAILQNHTRMSVLQVNEPTRLEPNTVYVIPPDRWLLITGESVAAAPFAAKRVAPGADFVLPVADLARTLAGLIRTRGQVSLHTYKEGHEDLLHRILAYLRSRTGQDFSGYKRATLMRRVARRVQVTHTQRRS